MYIGVAPSQGDCTVRYRPKPIDIEPAVLTIRQASVYSNLSVGTIYNKLKDGSLTKTKVGSRTLIHKASLNEMLGLPARS
jgi:excisionase family DNA binding protein